MLGGPGRATSDPGSALQPALKHEIEAFWSPDAADATLVAAPAAPKLHGRRGQQVLGGVLLQYTSRDWPRSCPPAPLVHTWLIEPLFRGGVMAVAARHKDIARRHGQPRRGGRYTEVFALAARRLLLENAAVHTLSRTSPTDHTNFWSPRCGGARAITTALFWPLPCVTSSRTYLCRRRAEAEPQLRSHPVDPALHCLRRRSSLRHTSCRTIPVPGRERPPRLRRTGRTDDLALSHRGCHVKRRRDPSKWPVRAETSPPRRRQN